MEQVIRNLAVGLPVRGEHILASAGGDRSTGAELCRASGGGIDFGETSAQALRREFREELGFEVTPTSLLGVLENLFEFAGARGHEIVHVFAVESSEIDALSLDAELTILDKGNPVRWYTRSQFAAQKPPLYPAGILNLLPD
jgi:8-oxo-dGTP pyrophosphatase MutT (NUDIX family)